MVPEVDARTMRGRCPARARRAAARGCRRRAARTSCRPSSGLSETKPGEVVDGLDAVERARAPRRGPCRSPWTTRASASRGLGGGVAARARAPGGPPRRSRGTRCAPRKPVPPVTRIFTTSPPPRTAPCALVGPQLGAGVCVERRAPCPSLQRLHRLLDQPRHVPVALAARHALRVAACSVVVASSGGPMCAASSRCFGQDRALGQRVVRAVQVHRQDVDLVGQREVAERRLEVDHLAGRSSACPRGR